MSTDDILNAGQSAAKDGFFQFLFSTKSEMAIVGPGGTGKTFLLSHLIDTIMPKYEQMAELMGIQTRYEGVVFTATTNKAAEVMAEATGRPTQTIQSFLNLVVRNDYATGTSKLERTKKWEPHYNLVIVVDEGSMVDYPLLQELRAATVNCKIIFLGDDCQLTPVGSATCPAFTQDIPMYELTQPMRNADYPDLQNLCNNVRESVKTGIFTDIQLVPGVIDYLNNEGMQAELDNNFLDAHANQRILCYTNARVGQYNKYVRGIRELPHVFAEGEELVNNAACKINGQRMSVEMQVTIEKRGQPKEHVLPDGSTIDVVYCDLRTKYGGILYGIPVPIDSDHFQSLVKWYRKEKLWTMYYHLQENFPDLRQKDACTFHKSQGSSYDVVYIDLGNLSTCHNPSTAARMLYVAVSRARKRVVFYGNLAPKYGKLVH